MTRGEIAIVAGLAALTGCSKPGMSRAERERGKELTMKMWGDPSKEIEKFQWGPKTALRGPGNDLPGTMQKDKGRGR